MLNVRGRVMPVKLGKFQCELKHGGTARERLQMGKKEEVRGVS